MSFGFCGNNSVFFSFSQYLFVIDNEFSLWKKGGEKIWYSLSPDTNI